MMRFNLKMLLVLLVLSLVGAYALFEVWDEASREAQAREAEAGAEQAMADARAASEAATLPPGWTKETRTVTLALPLGNREAELTFWVNTVGMEFVPLPAGQFRMGMDRVAGAEPAHWVNITRPLFMGAHEVTRAQYQQVTGKIASNRNGANLGEHPVLGLTWDDAVEFCTALSQREGLMYRLPTEAEWEYACRAGTTTKTYMGRRDSKELCVIFYKPEAIAIRENHQPRFGPEPVGTFPANPFGLFNMAGNVWEWCQDWYGADYYAHSPTDDPKGPPSGQIHVRRGGSYDLGRLGCRSSFRVGPQASDKRGGFRVVLE